MSDEIIAFSRAKHPAKHRGRVGLAALFFGLFAAPIVWAGNLMITYGLASHACYPGALPLDSADGFGFVWPLILAFYFIALIVCAAGGYVSYRNWSVTGSEAEELRRALSFHRSQERMQKVEVKLRAEHIPFRLRRQ